jgi:hypothetical protein
MVRIADTEPLLGGSNATDTSLCWKLYARRHDTVAEGTEVCTALDLHRIKVEEWRKG